MRMPSIFRVPLRNYDGEIVPGTFFPAFSRYAHLHEARRGILDDIRATGSIHGR